VSALLLRIRPCGNGSSSLLSLALFLPNENFSLTRYIDDAEHLLAGAGGAIPGGATLHFDVEVVDITDGPPPGPNVFVEIDTNADGKIDKSEVEAYFKNMGQDTVPPELWENEDKDGDGFISWEEFSGPKGSNPLGDEL